MALTETAGGVGLAELKRLAEAATPTEGATLNRYEHGGGRLFVALHTRGGSGRQLIADFYGDGADREFYAAANPATVLALIARIERLEGEKARLTWELNGERAMGRRRKRL